MARPLQKQRRRRWRDALIEVACLILPAAEGPHRHLVRTVPGERFAHLIGVEPPLTEQVRIEAGVLHRRDPISLRKMFTVSP